MVTMKVKEIIEIDGIQVYVCDSRHSIERFHERFDSRTSEADIMACLISMGPFILDLKNGQEFAIVDRPRNLMIIGGLNTLGVEVYFDLITVVKTTKYFVKEGTDTVVFDTRMLINNQTG